MNFYFYGCALSFSFILLDYPLSFINYPSTFLSIWISSSVWPPLLILPYPLMGRPPYHIDSMCIIDGITPFSLFSAQCWYRCYYVFNPDRWVYPVVIYRQPKISYPLFLEVLIGGLCSTITGYVYRSRVGFYFSDLSLIHSFFTDSLLTFLSA